MGFIPLLGKSFVKVSDSNFCKTVATISRDQVVYRSSLNAIENEANLTPLQKDKLIKLKTKYQEQLGNGSLGLAKGVSHVIDTGDHPPIKQRYYPTSPAMSKIMNQELDKLLESGVVVPSRSPWSSPVVMVKKKTGDMCICIDFRKVNKITKKDAYAIPYVSMTLDRLGKAKYLTSIDLESAYHQIPLDPDSMERLLLRSREGDISFCTTSVWPTQCPGYVPTFCGYGNWTRFGTFRFRLFRRCHHC